MTPTGRKLALWLGAFLAVFLIGFLPPYVRAGRLESELGNARQRIDLLELRDAAGLLYFEAAQKNYGLAGTEASRFFDRVRETAAETKDANLRRALEEILTSRDSVTAALARGNGSVLDVLQTLYVKTRDATKR